MEFFTFHKEVGLFIVGAVLSFLFYVEERLSDTENKIDDVRTFITLAIINGLLGGFIMVVVFYGLAQYFPDWNDYTKIGVAGGLATMGKDGFKFFHRRIKSKV